MKNLLRNTLAVVLGLVIGSIVNMSLIHVGMQLIPLPTGADVSTPEGLQAAIHLFEPQHFLTPFLAHAVGTLVGAFVAVLIAASQRQNIGYVVGVFFLAGGVYMVTILPAPLWFNALDVVVAYLPMAWLGGRIALRARPVQA